MFCKKCGNKLVAGEKICRHCGAPAEQAEVCGGFWGLVGEEPAPPASVPPVPPEPSAPPAPDPNPRYRRMLKQLADRQTILVVICAVLIVLTLAQFMQIGSLSDRVDSLEADVAVLETERKADDSASEKAAEREEAEQEETEQEDAEPEEGAQEGTEQENAELPDENESADGDGLSDDLSVPSESGDAVFYFSKGGECRVELPSANGQEESNSDDPYSFTYEYDGYDLEIKNSVETVIVSEDEAKVELTIRVKEYTFVQTLEDFDKKWDDNDTAEVSLESETGNVTLVLPKNGNTCELQYNDGTSETVDFTYNKSERLLIVGGVTAERTLQFTYTDEVSSSGEYTFVLGDEDLDELLALAKSGAEEDD